LIEASKDQFGEALDAAGDVVKSANKAAKTSFEACLKGKKK